MLSEKEIEDIIIPRIWIHRGHGELAHIRGVDDAAHAIFERLAEREQAHAAALATRDVELAEMAGLLKRYRESHDFAKRIGDCHCFECVSAKRLLAATPKRVLAMATLSKEYDDISETIVYKTGWEPPQDVEFHIEVFGKAQAEFSKAKSVTVAVMKGGACEAVGCV